MMRLDKFLADAGVGTRSEIKKLVRGGKIVVNNETARKPEQKVEPQTDRIFAEGKEISYEKFIYYLFHKPAGCVTAKQDKKDNQGGLQAQRGKISDRVRHCFCGKKRHRGKKLCRC